MINFFLSATTYSASTLRTNFMFDEVNKTADIKRAKEGTEAVRQFITSAARNKPVESILTLLDLKDFESFPDIHIERENIGVIPFISPIKSPQVEANDAVEIFIRSSVLQQRSQKRPLLIGLDWI